MFSWGFEGPYREKDEAKFAISKNVMPTLVKLHFDLRAQLLAEVEGGGRNGAGFRIVVRCL